MRTLRRLSSLFVVSALALGSPLWSQETGPATCLVRDAVKGDGNQMPAIVLLGATSKGNLFAASDDAAYPGTQILWITDAAVGAKPITALCAGCSVWAPIPLGDAVIFEADGTWRSDGTVAGTWRVPHYPTVDPSSSYSRTARTVVGGRLVSTECTDSDVGCQLWYLEPAGRTWKALSSFEPSGDYTPLGTLEVVVLGSDMFVLVHNRLWRVDSRTGTTDMVWHADYPDASSLVGLQNRVVWLGGLADDSMSVWSFGLQDKRLRTLNPPGLEDEPYRGGFAVAEGRAYIWLVDEEHGSEIWSTDGVAPMRRETDFQDTSATSSLKLVRAGSSLVFRVRFAGSNGGLYALTQPGNPPRLIQDYCDTCQRHFDGSTDGLARLGSRAVFVGGDTAGGFELWSTDGTVSGTTRLLDHCPGTCSARFEEFHSADGGVLVPAVSYYAGTQHADLLTTDAVSDRTYSIGPLPDFTNNPRQAKLFWNPRTRRFVYEAKSPTPGIYVADPKVENSATAIVKARRFPLGLNPTNLTAFAGGLALESVDSNDQRQFWALSGSPPTLRKLPHGRSNCGVQCPSPFIATGERFVYFFRGDAWSSNGTPSGGIQLTQFNDPWGGSPSMLSWSGKAIWFRNGEMWLTDGTPGGTTHFEVPSGFSSYDGPTLLADLGPDFYFQVDGRTWRSDGTASGTTAVNEPREARVICSITSTSEELVVGMIEAGVGGDQFGVWTYEPSTKSWTSLGRLDGFGECRGAPVSWGGAAYFFRATPRSRYDDEIVGRLWRVSGQGAPQELMERNADSSEGSLMAEIVATSAGLWWPFDDGVKGSELWFSGGTTSTTRVVSDLFPGSYGSGPTDLTVTPQGLLFAGLNPLSGRELWFASNGSVAPGLIDVNKGAPSSAPAEFTMLGNRIYFAATRADVGRELFYWSPNGCNR